LKQFYDKKKGELEAEKSRLEREKENNKETSAQIFQESLQLGKDREKRAKCEKEKEDLMSEVATKRNQLSSDAQKLANQRINVSSINMALEEKMQRLDANKKKYNATKERLGKEKGAQENLESANKLCEGEFKQSENLLTEVQKEIQAQKDNLFKYSQELFKLRAEQANHIGAISSTLSASRNLQAAINKLQVEAQRQQELTYNADYDIQKITRDVAYLQGQRSQEETEKLTAEINVAQEELSKHEENYRLLNTSNRKLNDELEYIKKTIATVAHDKENLTTMYSELILENEMTQRDLDKVIKGKEKTLVDHDVMKLEIKKLRDIVNVEADRVYGLENRKSQLEMSMEEREKEIQVHKDILSSEFKAAEEERHKVAVELQFRKSKVKNLRIKYEGLVQKNSSSSGEVDAPGEHSQAYYVIKAA
jgi:coiled-coil domain-containing protein 39